MNEKQGIKCSQLKLHTKRSAIIFNYLHEIYMRMHIFFFFFKRCLQRENFLRWSGRGINFHDKFAASSQMIYLPGREWAFSIPFGFCPKLQQGSACVGSSATEYQNNFHFSPTLAARIHYPRDPLSRHNS